jgi:hypothetical protein
MAQEPQRVVGLHVQVSPEQHRWIKGMAAQLPRGKVAHVVRALIELTREDAALEARLAQRLEELDADT